MLRNSNLFTVVCHWRPGEDAKEGWRTVVVVIYNEFCAKDAANEACLFLIWEQQGQTQPLLVIAGAPKLEIPNAAVFDAQEYGDTITFSRGKIVHCSEPT
jgi:hypothetical protein